MDVDLIVFDMAGTTVLDGDAVNHTLKQALAAAGVRASREEINAVMGMPKPVAIEALLAKCRGHAAASPLAVEAVYTDFVQRMLWHYESHPGVAECDGASEHSRGAAATASVRLSTPGSAATSPTPSSGDCAGRTAA